VFFCVGSARERVLRSSVFIMNCSFEILQKKVYWFPCLLVMWTFPSSPFSLVSFCVCVLYYYHYTMRPHSTSSFALFMSPSSLLDTTRNMQFEAQEGYIMMRFVECVHTYTQHYLKQQVDKRSCLCYNNLYSTFTLPTLYFICWDEWRLGVKCKIY